MGLDTVELVMAFEERFGIEIPDEAAEIVTVRDAIDFIYSQVPHASEAPRPVCLTQHAFYRVRRVVQTEFGASRREVRQSTPLEAIVPLEGRQAAWARMHRALELTKWPSLRRSPALVAQIGIASAASAALLLTATHSQGLAAAAAAASAALLLRVTERYRIHIATPQTVGDLANYLVAHGPPHTGKIGGDGWTYEQVREVVRKIVSEHLNVDPSFSDDASFIDDLGAD